MKTTATALRKDLYNVLDRVLETGEPVEIERNGRIVRLVADRPPSRFDRLVRRDVVVGDPGDLVAMDWSGEWTP